MRALLVFVLSLLTATVTMNPASQTTPWPVTFTDVAAEAGLVHPSMYGGLDRKRFIIETNGSGVALVDVDNDGWLDAFVLSGTRLKEGTREDAAFPAAEAPTNRLYRNTRKGRFEDVTDLAGLRRTGWASGVCAGDYDNDGWTDLFVTYFGHNVLYRNRGAGRFEDVTIGAGLGGKTPRWGSGCTFVDIDRDGRLDLFVSNYLRFDLKTAPEPGSGANCTWKGIPVNCGPKGLPTDTNLLYRNEGNGKFVDVSESSGIARVTGRYPMTALALDMDGDSWTDIYVASDSTAAILYRNNRDGTFTDVAVESGTAYGDQGTAQAGMGVAAGDYNNDGLIDLVKTHFADDIPSLYRNLGKGLFEDTAMAAGLNVQNRHVEWGVGLTDFDNDGRADLFYVTGNVYPEIEKLLPQYPHRGPAGPLSKQGRRSFRGCDRFDGCWRAQRTVEPRRSVWRRRQRRRRRRARDEHERAAVVTAERLERRQQLGSGCARGQSVEPIGDRRNRDRYRRRHPPGPRRPEPGQLLFARRPPSALRPRNRGACRRDRDPLAVGSGATSQKR